MLLPVAFFSLMASLMIITNVPVLANSMPGLTGLAAVVAVIIALAAMMLWHPEDIPDYVPFSGWHPEPKAHHWHRRHWHGAPSGRAGQRDGSNI
jgi:hypothetical protein